MDKSVESFLPLTRRFIFGTLISRRSLNGLICANRYFRHFKMYQYAFMPTFILNIETLETGNFVELPPYIFQLKAFAPQDEYDEEQERIRKEQEVSSIPFLMLDENSCLNISSKNFINIMPIPETI
jgi:hypothetical protein